MRLVHPAAHLCIPNFISCPSKIKQKVTELRPEPQVTVIDTDMEIELDLPTDAREQQEEKSAQERAKTMRAHMKSMLPNRSPGQSLSPRPRVTEKGGINLDQSVVMTGGGRGGSLSPMDDGENDSDPDSDDEESEKVENVFDPEKHRLAKLEGLPEEPARNEDGVFTCQLRSSQGKFTRRFRFSDRLGVLLDFAEAQGGVPGQYRLVLPFPRRVLTRDDATAEKTLREAGLTSKQESLILERG